MPTDTQSAPTIPTGPWPNDMPPPPPPAMPEPSSSTETATTEETEKQKEKTAKKKAAEKEAFGEELPDLLHFKYFSESGF